MIEKTITTKERERKRKITLLKHYNYYALISSCTMLTIYKKIIINNIHCQLTFKLNVGIGNNFYRNYFLEQNTNTKLTAGVKWHFFSFKSFCTTSFFQVDLHLKVIKSLFYLIRRANENCKIPKIIWFIWFVSCNRSILDIYHCSNDAIRLIFL